MTEKFAVEIDKDPWTSMRESFGTVTDDDGSQYRWAVCLSGTALFVYPEGKDSSGGGLRADLKPLIEHMVVQQREKKETAA